MIIEAERDAETTMVSWRDSESGVICVPSVTGDQVASIKAALKGDSEGFRRIDAQLDQATKGARGALVAAAFAQAAYRRFAEPDDPRVL